ncbi:MAG: prepilin-type N-terminal cleavage/methylation domain-containing protein [Abditibacteriaceae bacterium]
MKRTNRIKRSGFTLIEILVVIGIIALLAAILFPVLSRARESARAKACMSNLQQLGLAFQQYTQDYGRRYPGAGQYQKWDLGGHWVSGPHNQPIASLSPPYGPFPTTAGSTTYYTANVEGGALYSYVRSDGVYVCPSNVDGSKKLLTYSMNCAIAGMNDVRLRTPSEIVLLVDEDKANDGFFYVPGTNPVPFTSTDSLTKVHNDGGNILFCDGHVKFYPYNAYPLTIAPNAPNDSTNPAYELKSRTTGTPRFFDKAFGTNGYYDSGTLAFGSCNTPSF